jgi:hypothetical protein
MSDVEARTDYRPADDFWSDPFNGKGMLIVDLPWKRTWITCDERTGMPTAECTVTNVDPIIEANKQRRNDKAGEPWRDGDILASIPMDLYFRKIQPMRDAGDEKALRRWLNDSDNRAFRNREGQA